MSRKSSTIQYITTCLHCAFHTMHGMAMRQAKKHIEDGCSGPLAIMLIRKEKRKKKKEQNANISTTFYILGKRKD